MHCRGGWKKNTNLKYIRLCDDQKKDTSCRTLAAQSQYKNKNSFNSVMISPDGFLQKQQYIHGLKHDIVIALHSIVPTILHEFHNSKGHQETILTFKAIRRFYLWPKLCQDIMKYINKCDICAKNLPNLAKYPQKHQEIPQVPMAVLAMDTRGHLSVISRGCWWALTAIWMHMSYVFAILMKEKSAENVDQAYISGIFAYKGGRIAIFSDNGTEFKNSSNWCMLTTWCIESIFKSVSSTRELKNWEYAQFS